METPSKTQRLVLSYLLEQLPPEERERIDEALITDQEFSDSFAEARNDWLDAYASGSLPPKWKQLVEQALIDPSDGASLLPVAAALRARRTLTLPKVPRRSAVRAAFSFLAAVPVACVLLAIWLRSGPSPMSARHGLRGPVPPPVAMVKRAPPPVPMAPSTFPGTPAPSVAPRQTLALVMPSEILRGSESVPLVLTAAVERVQVQWPLSPDETAPVHVLVASRDGAPAAKFPQHGVVRTIGSERVATFQLPAAALPDGEYIFALVDSQTGEGTPVAQFSVSVSRKTRAHGVVE